MAGEDPEMVEIKPGYRIGLVFNKEEKVQKIVLNNKDKFPNAIVMEVEQADIEHDLFVKGYLEGDEEEVWNISIFFQMPF